MRQITGAVFTKAKSVMNWTPMDYRLFICIVLINLYGVVMIYSASYYFCGKSADCNYDAAYLFKNQTMWVILGIAVMLFMSMIDYHLWRKIILLGLAACVAMSVALRIPRVGISVNGATRWIRIGGFSLQVAEPIKAILIYWMAHYIARYRVNRLGNTAGYVISIVAISGFLGKMSNNMSVVIIIWLIAAVMFFVSNPGWKRYGILIAIALAAVAVVILYVLSVEITDDTSFRIVRIRAWLDPSVDTNASFQPQNALYAIGSGGIWGKGLGQSLQKYMIPEPQNDFILAIISEELGLVGVTALLSLFLYLLYRIVKIVRNAPDLLGKFLAAGVFLHIAIQTVMNVAVVTNAIPTTGVTLPFVSAGGTAAFFMLVELGLVMSVDKFSKQKKAESSARKKAREESLYGTDL